MPLYWAVSVVCTQAELPVRLMRPCVLYAFETGKHAQWFLFVCLLLFFCLFVCFWVFVVVVVLGFFLRGPRAHLN